MWFWCIICIASRCSIHIMIIMCMYVCIYIYINLWIYSSTATGCHDHPSGIWEMVLCLMLSSWYTYLDAAFSNIHLQAFCSGAYFQRSMKLWKAEKPLKNKQGENTTNKINKGTVAQIIRSSDPKMEAISIGEYLTCDPSPRRGRRHPKSHLGLNVAVIKKGTGKSMEFRYAD